MKPEKIKDQIFWKFDTPMRGEYDEFTRLAIRPNQLFCSLLISQTFLIDWSPRPRPDSIRGKSTNPDSIAPLKRCAKCNQEKPITEFKRRSPSSKYFKSYCIQCDETYHDKYRAKFPKKLLPKDDIAKIVKEIIK